MIITVPMKRPGASASPLTDCPSENDSIAILADAINQLAIVVEDVMVSDSPGSIRRALHRRQLRKLRESVAELIPK